MQYHASLITADGAYHCPVGSIMAIFSSVRSSNSHPDLLLIHPPPPPPHFFRSHWSLTLDLKYKGYNAIKKSKTLQDFGKLWNTLAYSGILWHTLAYSGILWHTLAYSGTLLFCYSVTLLLCYSVTLLLCYSVTL